MEQSAHPSARLKEHEESLVKLVDAFCRYRFTLHVAVVSHPRPMPRHVRARALLM
jgi:hypothetical protein